MPVVVVGMVTASTVIQLNPLKQGASAHSDPMTSVRKLQFPGKARKAFEKCMKELHNQQRLERSVKYFQGTIELHPDYDDPYARLRLAYFIQSQLNKAELVLRKANEVSAENAPARALLGKVLFQQGQAEQAILEFSEAVRLNDRFWGAHLDLGKALLEKGKVEEAYRHAVRAHELNQTDVKVHLLYSNACVRLGDYEAALKELDEFVQLYPDSSAAAKMHALREELAQTVGLQEK